MDTNTPDEGQTFEQVVNTAVDSLVTGEDGKIAVKEGVEMPEHVLFAATAEKRRRDTQAEYTRNQTRLKQLERENTELKLGWEKDAISKLPVEAQEELENLKLTDPDAWRAKINELEAEQKTKFGTKLDEVRKSAEESTTLETRAEQFEAFKAANPELELNDDVIANDIPPRFVKQLEKGEIDFATFLNKCGEFLSKGKVLKPAPAPGEQATLDDVGGGIVPGTEAEAKQASVSYSKETY